MMIAPMTLGNALDNEVALILGCDDCGRSTRPDVAALVDRHGRGFPVPALAERGRCTACGGRRCWVRVSGYKG